MTLWLTVGGLLAFIPYFIVVWRAPGWLWARSWPVIVAVAIALRLALLAMPVVLSDDVYRYLWDGQIQCAGFNPYRYAPDAPELAGLRNENWTRVDHREVPTAYPPVMLLMFRAVAAVSTSVWLFKLAAVIFDLATCWLLVQLLRARGQNESLAVIWAWNPLVVLEFAGSGHVMSLAIAFFLAGLWALQRRQAALAAAALAAATLTHLLALPVAVMALVAARAKSARAWLVFVGMLLAGFALFADAGQHLWLGLFHYAARWRFNGSLFEILTQVASDVPRQGFGGVWVSDRRAKIIVAVLLASIAGWSWWRRYDPARAALAVGGMLLLLAPAVHPWYVTWLVALVCLEFRLSWLMFSAVVLMSYVAKIVQEQTGIWVDSSYVRWLEYAPLYGLLVIDLWRKRFDSAARTR